MLDNKTFSPPKVQVSNLELIIFTVGDYLLLGIYYLENDEQIFIFSLPISNQDTAYHMMKMT